MRKINLAILTVLTALMAIIGNYSLAKGQQANTVYEEYKQAKKLIHELKWEQAIQACKGIIKTFPESDFVDDAQFWIGYCYENWEDHQEIAIDEFQKLVDNYSSSPWVDDACNYQIIIVDQIYKPQSKKYGEVVFRAMRNLVEYLARMCEDYQRKVDQKVITLETAQEEAKNILREQAIGLNGYVTTISDEGKLIATKFRKNEGKKISHFDVIKNIVEKKEGIHRVVMPYYTSVISYLYYERWGWIIITNLLERDQRLFQTKYKKSRKTGITNHKIDIIRKGLQLDDPKYSYDCLFTDKNIKIDGILDECRGAAPIVLDDSSQTKSSLYAGIWNGPDDLSAKIYLLWNQDYLYFGAKVIDDIRSQPYNCPNSWHGDGIQVSFDTQNDRATRIMKDDYEYGFVLSPSGTKVFSYFGIQACFDTQNDKAVRSMKYDQEYGFVLSPDDNDVYYHYGRQGIIENVDIVIRQEKDNVWIYEVALPWKLLKPFVPKQGAVMGMNVLINDNDGQGRKNWIEWTAGVGESKDPSLYGKLVFKRK